jgi:hypothetical protein
VFEGRTIYRHRSLRPYTNAFPLGIASGAADGIDDRNLYAVTGAPKSESWLTLFAFVEDVARVLCTHKYPTGLRQFVHPVADADIARPEESDVGYRCAIDNYHELAVNVIVNGSK